MPGYTKPELPMLVSGNVLDSSVVCFSSLYVSSSFRSTADGIVVSRLQGQARKEGALRYQAMIVCDARIITQGTSLGRWGGLFLLLVFHREPDW